MKRLFALLLAVLLLTGCAGTQVHSNPCPISGGEPVGERGNLWYIPSEAVEAIRPVQLLDTPAGLLVYGGGKMALLHREDMTVLAEREFEVGALAYVQEITDCVCLMDPEAGTITELDGKLQTIRVREMEPGDDLRLLSMDGTQLYTFAENSICLDGQELWRFRYMSVSAFWDGRVFLTAVAETDLLTRRYVLDLDTGLLTEREGAAKKALRDGLQAIPGNRWLYPWGRELRIYAEDGTFLTYTALPGGESSVCGRDFVWSEALNGWLFLDYSPEKTVLMFWDAGLELISEPWNLASETVPAANGLTPELYARAEELSRRFCVDIRIGTRAVRDYTSYTAEPLTDPEVTAQTLELLERALGRYPEGFLRQLAFSETEIIRIELVDALQKKNDDGEEKYAFAQQRDEYYLLVFNARNLREEAIYHELSHVTDERLAWEAALRPGALYSEEGWMALQPEGFEYAGGYTDIPNSVKKFYDSGYFARDYACVSATEDRAVTMEKAMMLERQVFAENPMVLPKLRYYCDCIRDSFNTEGWPEVLPWEMVLTDP